MKIRHSHHSSDRHHQRAHTSMRSGRRYTSITLALACLCMAIIPAVGLAAARPLMTNYEVSVNPNALASGKTVRTKVTVTSPETKVKSWWSQKTVAAVVRKGVNGGRQTPYSTEGYRCTPVVRGETTSFTCKLVGADVPTVVRLAFVVTYRGDQASG